MYVLEFSLGFLINIFKIFLLPLYLYILDILHIKHIYKLYFLEDQKLDSSWIM
jgi:hypothetical protein